MTGQFIIVKSYEEGIKEIKNLLSILTITPFNNEVVERRGENCGVDVIGKRFIPIWKNNNRNEYCYNKIHVFHAIFTVFLENVSFLTEAQFCCIITFLKDNFKKLRIYQKLIKFAETLRNFDKTKHVIVYETRDNIHYWYNTTIFIKSKPNSAHSCDYVRKNENYSTFLIWMIEDYNINITFKPKSEVLSVFKEIIEKHINHYKESMENVKKKEIEDIKAITTRTTNELNSYNDRINDYKDLLSEF